MNILIADDNRLDRVLIENILKKSHYKIIAAKNGDEALCAYRNDHFDLIILDWMMPPTGGLTICKTIRDNESKSGDFCYIIMVTAKKMVEDEVRAFEVGVNDFITKPFNEATLIVRVKAGLRIVSERNELLAQLRSDD